MRQMMVFPWLSKDEKSVPLVSAGLCPTATVAVTHPGPGMRTDVVQILRRVCYCARNPEGFEINDVLTAYQGRSRTLVYHDGQGKFRNANNPARASTANAWLRENPYRIQLGRLGLLLLNRDGSRARLDQLQNARQTLDLWTSYLDSRFEFTGEEVRVETVCHPEKDLVAVRVSSPLVKQGRVGVEFGCDERTRLNPSMRDARRCDFKCSLLTSNYFAALTVSFPQNGKWSVRWEGIRPMP